MDICDNCEKLAFRICGKCKQIAYCSKDCQVSSWKTHKNVCRILLMKPEELKLFFQDLYNRIVNSELYKMQLLSLKPDQEITITYDYDNEKVVPGFRDKTDKLEFNILFKRTNRIIYF